MLSGFRVSLVAIAAAVACSHASPAAATSSLQRDPQVAASPCAAPGAAKASDELVTAVPFEHGMPGPAAGDALRPASRPMMDPVGGRHVSAEIPG